MAKFVELNEAAKMLGLTPDQLVEMRSNGDIHGYRDGAGAALRPAGAELAHAP